MEYLVTNEKSQKHAEEIVQFLKGPRLYIPETTYTGYPSWLENKVHPQLTNGSKMATVCFDRSRVSGVIVYQSHPLISNAAEIRNITVRPTSRGRLLGSFLLRNTEFEAKQFFKAKKIIVDCKLANTAMMQFLLHHGYLIEEVRDLYNCGDGLDVVMSKKL